MAEGQTPKYFHSVAIRNGTTITVSSSGAYTGFINYKIPIFASDCTTIQSKDEKLLIADYLLKSKQEDFNKLQKGMWQPHV